jgi:hypothetical protein
MTFGVGGPVLRVTDAAWICERRLIPIRCVRSTAKPSFHVNRQGDFIGTHVARAGR